MTWFFTMVYNSCTSLSLKMKFKYRTFKKQDDPNIQYAKMPLLQVQLKHGKKSLDIECLVDSGAEDCLFNADVAAALGIDLTKGTAHKYEGIGNILVAGHVYPIMLKVKGFETWIRIEAGFIDENEISLLGQTGFFENYEVIFRGYRKQFEIKNKST